MVGEPRGSAPPLNCRQVCLTVEMVAKLEVFFFRWMHGWRVGWTHPEPNSQGFFVGSSRLVFLKGTVPHPGDFIE